MDSLASLDAELASLLEARIALLRAPDALSLDDQVAMDPPGGLEPALWRALCAGTMAAAKRGANRAYSHAGRRVVIVGGGGAMGGLLGAAFARCGHTVDALDAADWGRAGELLGACDLALVAVPIGVTEEVIGRAARHVCASAILADITSVKVGPVAAMLETHAGPVLGLHPMFGPHVTSLLAQRVVACPARSSVEAAWVLDVFRAEGATIVESTPEEHDSMMVAVQAIRHFTTFALGVFLAEEGVDVSRSLDFASPIYRLEIDIVSRLFAQSPELYFSIMSASSERIGAIDRFAGTVCRLAEAIGRTDGSALGAAFAMTAARLGSEAPRAMDETALAVEALSTALAARSA